MEAEQVILECLEYEDSGPFDALIEGLVLGGESSLFLLREVLEEVLNAKSTLAQDGLIVRQDLMEALSEFGVHLPQLLYVDAPDAFYKIYNQSIRLEFRDSNPELDGADESLLEEICIEAGDRVMQIARGLSLLRGIEDSVRDWIASLAYEAVHSREDFHGKTDSSYLH
jgi:hypothetical protein